ncbi:pilus assembly protein [Saccharobesus litoralis]|uniref:Pilus assembly protein n=1 Tax=Saccharobesus litoralis TaxID=2172099 RepID=A0A2S0VPD9_9ALTE|nr:pirin family protein [Saccharobesus litoralis]AWB66087.1 pilus assembly protein [Saccharobesus litoralis]
MKILHRDSLPRGGFAGLRETRLIYDKRINPSAPDHVWQGLGNFVYLADAKYLPYGETKMHSHKEIDIVTVLLEGQLAHEGSLEHGQSLEAPQVQVQRAGGEGFSHNEINPNEDGTRLLQIWVLPEQAGLPAQYKVYNPALNQMQRIYGGNKTQTETFDSNTVIEVGVLNKGAVIERQGDCLIYVVNGQATINDQLVQDGDLVRGADLNLLVTSEQVHLSVFYVEL